jgi:hypothetical protein
MGSFSTLLGPLISLPSIANAQSCSGWTEVLAGIILGREARTQGPYPPYYYYCDYYYYVTNYYYNGVFQYSHESPAGESCTLR